MAETKWGEWTVVSTKKVKKALSPKEMKKIVGGIAKMSQTNCRTTTSKRCAQIITQRKVGRRMVSTATNDESNCQTTTSTNCS